MNLSTFGCASALVLGVLVAACSPPDDAIEQVATQPEAVDVEPIETVVVPTVPELRQAACLRGVKVYMQSLESSVDEMSEPTTERLIVSGTVSGTDSVSDKAFSAICDFAGPDSSALTGLTLNGTRLSEMGLTKSSFPAGPVVEITDVQRRQLTTTAADGTVTKYFATIDFDIPAGETEYCLAVAHISPDEGRDSLFASTLDGDWVVIDLPESEELVTSVTSFVLPASGSVFMRNRENAQTAGFAALPCE